ncbi:hypothetical protein L207DRAFT_508410 [Hyaloscypha variabilis F]|uniref:Heterokaryon incompatibility domain-containing protein n=1 Tax=Hyaloscypha variabilis (strain UAMH 11265 / GT02V1 / F) TaxID=1149755 RepID=A0A2J6S453_HYAVF|nr:hypothetical protein L207DRAFT_508410 [Hyaloscypha variabilis F]
MDPTRQTIFPYKALNTDKSDIRLIRITPSRDRASRVRCTLIHKSLDTSNHLYEALSYSWGGNILDKLIQLNGLDFRVTKNLEAALRALRKDDEDRYLWVDAICINQADVRERNREVLRMRKIYEVAHRVVVWLGQEKDTTGVAIQHLKDLERQWERRISRRLPARILDFSSFLFSFVILWSSLLLRTILIQLKLYWSNWVLLITIFIEIKFFSNIPFVGWLFVIYGLYHGITSVFWLFSGYLDSFSRAANSQSYATSTDKVTLAALNDFFSREWFSRVWIIQEIAVARDILVVCGSYELSWKSLIHANLQLAYLTTESWSRSTYTQVGFQRLGHIIRSLEMEDTRTCQSQPMRRSLLALLCCFSISDASKAHDKVYGLLGLSDEMRNASSDIPAIEVRYEEPVEDTYTSVAKFLIESSGNLSALSACQGSRPLANLPSWVPDWNTKAWRPEEAEGGTGEPYRLKGEDASIPVAEFSSDLKVVALRGFIVGSLSELIYKSARKDQNGERFGLRLLETFANLARPILGLLLVKCGILNLVAKALLLIDQEVGESCLELAQYFRLRFKHNFRFSLDTDRLAMDFHEDLMAGTFRLQPISQLPICHITSCTSFAPDVRLKDKVCMMVGAEHPLILRHAEKGWTLVGTGHITLPEKFVWEKCCRLYAEGRIDLKKFLVR